MSRLDELLAKNLDLSKSAVARLIAEGVVTTVDGEILDDRRAKIGATGATAAAGAPAIVLVEGQPVTLFETAFVLLHKPVGVVTALRDAIHPTAYSLVQDAPLAALLRPAGRLDLDTSGLLLWTTEGALIQRLTHPKRRVPRVYHAALAGPYRPLSGGLTLEDGHRPEVIALDELSRAAAHPALVVPDGTTTLASITVVSGAYHEIRRIFAALGSHVLGLCRVRFGAYELPLDLPAGRWQPLALPPSP